MNSPTPEQVKEARHNVGHSQQDAANTIMVGIRTWQGYEYGEAKMHKAFFKLYLLDTGQEKLISKYFDMLCAGHE